VHSWKISYIFTLETAATNTNYPFLRGGGEMGELTRQYKWEQTAIGTPDQWPQSLRTTLSIILNSKFPMFLFWGEQHLCFYNDAYRPSLGNEGKHPDALGQPGTQVWPEIWPVIKPLIDQVLAGGEATWSEDQLIPIYRNGELDDVYWSFSYSPVIDESNRIAGVFVTCTETTQKVTNLKHLEESNQQLTFAIEATELGTWDLDPITNRFTANARLKHWFGLQPNDEIELPLAINAIAERDRQRVAEAINDALHYGSGGRYDIDYTIVHPATQQERFVKAKGKAWFNEAQKAYRFNGTLQDITEHKKAEQALIESEQTLRSLVASAPFPIGVYVGRQMRIQLANQSIINIWGKGNDVVGKLYSEILPELADQHIYSQLDSVYTTGIAFHARNQRVDIQVNGKLQPYYFNYSFTPLYDADGQVYGVMNTAAEITDLVLVKQSLEKSEQRLRGAIELAELATWSMDIQTGTFHYSARFMKWLGFSESTKGLDEAYNPLPDEYRQSVADAIAAVIQPGSSGFYDNEHPIINRLTGQIRIIHAQAQVFTDSDGNPAVLSGTAQDVTEHRRIQLALEQQIQQRTEELETANEELAATNEELAATNEELTAVNEEVAAVNIGLEESNQLLTRSNENLEQFAYIASHDLQEPLRKIQQFSDLLKSRYIGSQGEELAYLERMQSAASRMSMLIKDLLAFSRISIRQVSEAFVSLTSVIDQALENLSVAIEESNAQIQISALPSVQGDALQLEQLFQNLLSNALKFSRREPTAGILPQIKVIAYYVMATDLPPTIKPTRQATIYCRIEVVDNGIGFDDKYADRIFQVFQRLHGRNEFAGTGVGLAICQKVVDNHGGAITASSQPGKGATFSVYLPLQ
jgi:PAS domain S-box-containing protein